MNQLVCDIRYAQRLKELGYPQNEESYFSFYDFQNEPGEPIALSIRETSYYEQQVNLISICAAPTAVELLEKLPKDFLNHQTRSFYSDILVTCKRGCYTVNYLTDDRDCGYNSKQKDASFSNALAKLLIYLLENNLMEFKK